MADNASSTAILYNGEFTFTVEGRRVAVPAKWLPPEFDPKTHPVEFSIVVWPQSVHGVFLRVMKREKLEELLANLNALETGNLRKGKLKRQIGRQSAQVQVDRQGRIQLPEGMPEAAGITDKAVFVGMLDQFEIWSPERNTAMRAAEQAEALEVFSALD